MTNTVKQRQSNMELLRIVAMFLVLVVHADFFSLGVPTLEETHDKIGPSTMRFFIESISIVCVNVFILLSGWFSIRPTWKSLGKFLFQCFFFLFGIYAVAIICGETTLTVKGIAQCLLMTKLNWFIKAYIGLYILSPVLNAFVDNSTKNQLLYVIVGFYIFQTLYGWFSNGAYFFEFGYSTLSFIGLYLLARYVRLYIEKRREEKRREEKRREEKRRGLSYISIYLLISCIITIIALGLTWFGLRGVSRMYVYTNPLVVLAALFLLLFFSELKFQSRFINWVGASSFAVFLLHSNPNLYTKFVEIVQHIYETTNGMTCLLLILSFLIAVFIAAILIDQIRIFMWKYISRFIENNARFGKIFR